MGKVGWPAPVLSLALGVRLNVSVPPSFCQRAKENSVIILQLMAKRQSGGDCGS